MRLPTGIALATLLLTACATRPLCEGPLPPDPVLSTADAPPPAALTGEDASAWVGRPLQLKAGTVVLGAPRQEASPLQQLTQDRWVYVSDLLDAGLGTWLFIDTEFGPGWVAAPSP